MYWERQTWAAHRLHAAELRPLIRCPCDPLTAPCRPPPSCERQAGGVGVSLSKELLANAGEALKARWVWGGAAGREAQRAPRHPCCCHTLPLSPRQTASLNPAALQIPFNPPNTPSKSPPPPTPPSPTQPPQANITKLGPLVLPLSEQLLFLANLIARKAAKARLSPPPARLLPCCCAALLGPPARRCLAAWHLAR